MFYIRNHSSLTLNHKPSLFTPCPFSQAASRYLCRVKSNIILMRDCIELLADIVEIYPVPGDKLSFVVPFQIQTPSIKAADIKLNDFNFSLSALRLHPGFRVGSYISSSTHTRIHEMEPDVSVKSQMKSSSAGSFFNVQVSLTSYDQPELLRDIASLLYHCDVFHLFVVDSDGKVYLVRGEAPSTSFSVTDSLPLSSGSQVTFDVVSVNGLQHVNM